jgi:hypothetical protein
MIAQVYSLENPKLIFCIISVCVDDLNIIGHAKDIDEARNHLIKEFKMKDLGKTKFCLEL